MSSEEVEEKHLDSVLRHINNVKEDCLLLGERLIEQEREELGRELIANGLIHDNSKLHGVEWLYLRQEIKEDKPDLFKAAFTQHIKTNRHHPECWSGGINDMAPVYLAEMVVDWKARSNEFGTDLWDWIKEEAISKYKLSTSGKQYKQLKEFLDLLLERRFK